MDFLESSRVSTTEDREAMRASFKDDARRLDRELQCSKPAKMMHTVKLGDIDGRLEDGDAARHDTIHVARC